MSGISSSPNWRRLLPKGLAVVGLLSAAGFGISHFFASPETENSNIVRGEGERNLRFESGKPAAGKSGSRIALIIGNNNYQHINKLENPANDAEDIAKALRGFGFKVLLRKNLDLRAMRDAIAEFGRESGNAEAALFYYAGHGVQSKNRNYLVPVTANVHTEADFEYETVNINYLLETLDDAKSHANIVMLDACRDNPFGGVRSTGTRGLANLAQVPKGTVIVYATDPGNTAEDGKGRNGTFTMGLLKAFKGNDLSLDGVLTVASAEVEKATNNQQVPYVNGPQTLKKNFHFAETVDPGPKQVEGEFWASIKDSRDPADFEAYLKQYPQGNFRPLAENRLKQLKTPPPAALQAPLPSPVVPPAVLPPAPTEKPAVTVPSAGKPASPPPSVPVTEKPVAPPPAAKPATPTVPEKPAATTVLPATPAPTTVKPAMPAPVPAKPAVPAVPVVPAVPAKPATPPPIPAKPVAPPPVTKPATPAPAPAKPTTSTPAEKPAAPAVKKPAEAAPAKKPAVESPEKPAKKQVTHPIAEKAAKKKPSSNEKENTSSSKTKPSHAETGGKPAQQPASKESNSTGILFRSQERWY